MTYQEERDAYLAGFLARYKETHYYSVLPSLSPTRVGLPGKEAAEQAKNALAYLKQAASE